MRLETLHPDVHPCPVDPSYGLGPSPVYALGIRQFYGRPFNPDRLSNIYINSCSSGLKSNLFSHPHPAHQSTLQHSSTTTTTPFRLYDQPTNNNQNGRSDPHHSMGAGRREERWSYVYLLPSSSTTSFDPNCLFCLLISLDIRSDIPKTRVPSPSPTQPTDPPPLALHLSESDTDMILYSHQVHGGPRPPARSR